MKKSFIILLVVLLAFIVYAAETSITTFTNGLIAENLTFTGDQNVTRFLSINNNANVVDISLGLDFLATFGTAVEGDSSTDNNGTLCISHGYCDMTMTDPLTINTAGKLAWRDTTPPFNNRWYADISHPNLHGEPIGGDFVQVQLSTEVYNIGPGTMVLAVGNEDAVNGTPVWISNNSLFCSFNDASGESCSGGCSFSVGHQGSRSHRFEINFTSGTYDFYSGGLQCDDYPLPEGLNTTKNINFFGDQGGGSNRISFGNLTEWNISNATTSIKVVAGTPSNVYIDVGDPPIDAIAGIETNITPAGTFLFQATSIDYTGVWITVNNPVTITVINISNGNTCDTAFIYNTTGTTATEVARSTINNDQATFNYALESKDYHLWIGNADGSACSRDSIDPFTYPHGTADITINNGSNTNDNSTVSSSTNQWWQINKILYIDTSVALSSQNISITPSAINNILDSGCDCIECTINAENCEIPFKFHSSTAGLLQYSNFNVTVAQNVGLCTDPSFNYPILNLTYIDEVTKATISVDNAFEISFNDGLFVHSVNGSSSTSTADAFCTDVNPADRVLDFDLTGTFTLSKDEYATKIYSFPTGGEISLTNNATTSQNLSLIRLNESTTVVFTWLTQSYEPIDGVMNIFQCNGDGTRTFIDATPIIDGQASANLVLVSVPYSYEIVANGETFTNPDSFTKCHVETETTRQFIVAVGQVDVAPTIGMYSIGCNLTKVNNNTVNMQWGDNPQNTDTITACMFAWRHTATGTTQVYTNCTTTDRNFTRTIPINAFDYSVEGKLFQSGFSISCEEAVEFKNETQGAQSFGPMAVLAMFFFIAGLALMFSEDAKKQLLGTSVGLLGGFIFGFVAFGWQTTSAILAFIILIMIVGRHSKKQ